MKKVAFYTLGCKLNFSETSTISRSFEERGIQKVQFHEKADIYIINTCSVTENADKKCKKVVQEALHTSPYAFIAIMGCYAQLKPKEIANIPGVDVVLGASEKFQLLDLIDSFEKKGKAVIFNKPISEVTDYYCSFSANDRTRTFLKLQDGCDYTCSFCTIPLARGKSRSDTLQNIINTATNIAATSVKEIVLTGINLGDVGLVSGKRLFNFFDVINALDNIEGINRYRISSIEPNLLSNDIISFVAKSDKFVPHFHIPLQSGSNKILGLMRRRYKKDLYQERVNYIKALMPDCCIGVDVIVGFPGETDEDFIETYNFLQALDISYLHVFTYSERENTLAAGLKQSVPMRTRNDRSKSLRLLSEDKRNSFYKNHIGEIKNVLFEADHENGIMHGFTDNYIKVRAQYDPLLINEIKKVKLKNINSEGFVEIEEVDEVFVY